MVSFHTALPDAPPSGVPATEFEASSKKRKWEEPLAREFLRDQTKADRRKSIFDIELHLETPLPSDKWQQYLGIQSGQIHNTKMNRKPAEDRKSAEPEPPSPGHMSLDLGLNLTCESPRNKTGSGYGVNEKQNRSSRGILKEHQDLFVESREEDKKGSEGLTRSPSWLSSEVDQKEMVATVCMRCHMLVMLCKSSPACPNCKFMHPPDQNPSTFLKRRCSLLC
ncbi:uncharacterized protein LOC114748778 [Neltuma alba]|uniref:uncharacterized protein LOC114729038 n=1 Tax=Neltuma alba TaxID=207710 RepID=UPI0010A4D133|nr:uncharacterized protein LOC114729038 [Prosopis alba]XP_028793065.1 uncharacterized protein LOC114748778 [Prosopis alba]